IIPAVFFFGIKGVVPGIILSSVATWLISRLFLHHEVGRVRVKTEPKDYWKSFHELLHFGLPFTASQLVGTGVQLALPIVVLHMLGTESVGYYRAALGISVGYLGFLITAMGQDYYPRLSAVHDSKEALVKLINEQHRLVMILAVPVILGTLALVPFLVPLVYSLQFGPTVAILEWQMIGDIFKFSSWTMSFAILARCGGTTYFLSELLGGIANVAVTWVCVKMFGLSGLGIGFLGAYILYYFIIWAFVRHELPLKWTSSNIKMMLGAVGAALVVRLLPATRFAHFRTPVALALALVTGVPSLFILWREFMVPKEAQPAAASAAAPAPPVEVSTEVHSSVD
ncbi:MAG: oligosaccharide flippase family protein, partial [Candidatus Acidiferrales bacterium]